MKNARTLLLMTLLSSGCPAPSEGADAGRVDRWNDTGGLDAGRVDRSPDSGPLVVNDTGGLDTPAVEETGVPDTGRLVPDDTGGLLGDTGSRDAGSPDAGALDASIASDAWTAPDARPTWDPRLGCLGGWSGPLFCGLGEECTSFPNECTPAPAPGMLLVGSICTSRSQCASGICDSARGFPSQYCFDRCERNADCAVGSTCMLPSGSRDAGLRRCTPVAGDCARCTAPSDYCDEEMFSAGGRGACLPACRTTSDCALGDCRIRNGSSLTPFCDGTRSDCADDEIRVDTDSGRRQACVKLRPCFDMAECAPGLSCVEVAYGGLSSPVRFCGRVL